MVLADRPRLQAGMCYERPPVSASVIGMARTKSGFSGFLGGRKDSTPEHAHGKILVSATAKSGLGNLRVR